MNDRFQENAGPLPGFLDPLGGPDAKRQVWGRSQENAGPLPSFLDPLGGPDAKRQVWGRSQDIASAWSAGTPAWSPLLVLGGSVVAAVMLIGGGLSMLGTEPTSAAPGARTALGAPATAPITTVAAAAPRAPGDDQRR